MLQKLFNFMCVAHHALTVIRYAVNKENKTTYRLRNSLASFESDSGISGWVLNIPTLKMVAAGSS